MSSDSDYAKSKVIGLSNLGVSLGAVASSDTGLGLCKHRGNRIQDKLATLCAGHVQPVSMLRLLESFDN